MSGKTLGGKPEPGGLLVIIPDGSKDRLGPKVLSSSAAESLPAWQCGDHELYLRARWNTISVSFSFARQVQVSVM